MAFILLLLPIMNSYAMTQQFNEPSNNHSLTMQVATTSSTIPDAKSNNNCCTEKSTHDCDSSAQCCSHCISIIRNSISNLTYNHYAIYSAQHYAFTLGQNPPPSIRPPRT